nr:MAG TPA: hypothetical protein [Caudoviricetes sp.]
MECYRARRQLVFRVARAQCGWQLEQRLERGPVVLQREQHVVELELEHLCASTFSNKFDSSHCAGFPSSLDGNHTQRTGSSR